MNTRHIKSKLLLTLLCTFSLQAELIVVNSTGDQSAVDPAVSALTAVNTITLRSALERADANADSSNEINFDIPLNQQTAGRWLIVPETSLPGVFAKQLILDGYALNTADPASPNTNPINQPNNADLKIELRGPGAGENLDPIDGIDFTFADDSVVRGVVINNFAGFYPDFGFGASGLFIFATNRMVIEGCFFGVDATGINSFPNLQAVGWVECADCLFGGPTPEARNLVSGSYTGAGMVAPFACIDTVIQGNTVGLDRSGDQVLTGFDSRINISIDFSEGTVIGGFLPEERNVISGGATYNVLLGDENIGDRVIGNYIGTSVGGDKTFDENGVGIETFNDDVDGLIANNLISGNAKGIVLGQNAFSFLPTSNYIIENNTIGLDATGEQALGNRNDGIFLNFALDTTIARNVISANDANGIRTSCAKRTHITDNRIGLDRTGTALFGNGRNGIQLGTLVAQGIPSEDDVIEGNIIAGNKLNGISIQSHAQSATVKNNFIGTTLTGDQFQRSNEGVYGNKKNGIAILCSTHNQILDNLIKNSCRDGIKLHSHANQNRIQGNEITHNRDDGIDICDSSCNLIGANDKNSCSATCKVERGNVIAYNGGYGVVVKGNSVDNAIVSNSIFDNKTHKGIELSTRHGGEPNHLQASPKLLSAKTNGTQIQVTGSLDSLPHGDFLIQFFNNSRRGKYEGKTLLGSIEVVTDSDGHDDFVATLSSLCIPINDCRFITATATRINHNELTDTSEFSKVVHVKK